MRGTAITIVVLLLLPLASSRAIHTPSITSLAEVPALDFESDANVLLLLAQSTGLNPQRHTLPPANPEDLPALAQRLATRAGTTLSPADLAAYASVDPRVSTPLASLLLSVDAAWTLRDNAFSGLTPDEHTRLLAHITADGTADPGTLRLVSQVNQTQLVESAILLLDTLESIVIPQLQEAVRQGAWPATATADPVGILRIGGTGNDVETLDRMIQIDPRGDDTYKNNAGATNFGDVGIARTTQPRFPISISLDFEGNDVYLGRGWQFGSTEHEGQGSALFGVGVLLDFAGNDVYRCRRYCQGGASAGVGYFRDYRGNDFSWGDANAGSGEAAGIGVHRDDAGDDTYHAHDGGGYSNEWRSREPVSVGLLWDRGGQDSYGTFGFGYLTAYGSTNGAGHGWFVDEGAAMDYYETAYQLGPHAHGCNDCTWTESIGNGTFNRGGHGNDNNGGLAYLLTLQNAV